MNDLWHRLRTVWRDVEGFNPQDTYSKLATYQLYLFLQCHLVLRCMPQFVCRDFCTLFVCQEAFKSVSTCLQKVSRFKLRAHTLGGDSIFGTWKLSFMWPLCLWTDSRWSACPFDVYRHRCLCFKEKVCLCAYLSSHSRVIFVAQCPADGLQFPLTTQQQTFCVCLSL